MEKKLGLKANLNTIVDPGKHVMAGEVLSGATCCIHIHCHLKSIKMMTDCSID